MKKAPGEARGALHTDVQHREEDEVQGGTPMGRGQDPIRFGHVEKLDLYHAPSDLGAGQSCTGGPRLL